MQNLKFPLPAVIIAAVLFASGAYLSGCARISPSISDRSGGDVSSPPEVDGIQSEQKRRPNFQIRYEDIKKTIQARIESAPKRLAAGDSYLRAPEMLINFYKGRAFSPAWIDDRGALERADNLIKIIADAENHGLVPSDYHVEEVKAVLQEAYRNQSAEIFADMEMLLTDAYLFYGSHLINGRVRPEKVDGNWLVRHREENPVQALNSALESNAIEETLSGFIPRESGYRTLQKTLIRYRQIASDGGWAKTPKGDKLSKGQRDIKVFFLRARLLASADLIAPGSGGDSDLFDDALEAALMNFQKRHGLRVDGILGDGTVDALNVPVEKRIEQIAINMERWRWLPPTLGERYVLVNIANYELYAVENREIVLSMRVVVGKPYWDTPVFGSKMTHIVLNPTWGIPDKIFADEILPKIQKNPNFIARDNIKIFEDKSGISTEIDPSTVDWASVSKGGFKYRLRQEPGPRNPLGQIKFIFPNRFDVYLHDTTSKHLFERRERNFSHGCIRLEKPFDLAEYILGGDSGWTAKKIKSAVGSEQPRSIRLANPIPIYLLYFTAWVDANGNVEFREDIYGRDKPLGKALAEIKDKIPSA
ncbi:MAG: L,D-transpeptidase family protein [Deltaproteobacteria bacterium]